MSETLSEDVRKRLSIWAQRRVAVGPDPAAGAEQNLVVPAGSAWIIYSLQFIFVTSATVANRRPALFLTDGSREFWRYASPANQAATQTNRYTWAPAVPSNSVITDNAIGLPFPGNIVFLPGWTIQTSTNALQVGDDYGPINACIREIDLTALEEVDDLISLVLPAL